MALWITAHLDRGSCFIGVAQAYRSIEEYLLTKVFTFGSGRSSEMKDKVRDTALDRQGRCIRHTLETLHPESVFEVRVLGIPDREKHHSASGYFLNADNAVRAVAAKYEVTGRCSGIYITLNPCRAELHQRSPEAVREYPKLATTDQDITKRSWFFVDIDPVRPANTPATELERLAAETLTDQLCEYLRGIGWPQPLRGFSGNGYALFYRIDLPNDDASTHLLKDCLRALAQRASEWTVEGGCTAKVDVTTYNASRLVRLFGTTNRKGTQEGDRTHRVSKLNVPNGPLQLVPRELLNDLASTAAQQSQVGRTGALELSEARATQAETVSCGSPSQRVLDVGRWLNSRGQAFRTKRTADGRTAYVLEHCPFNEEHGASGEVAVMQADNGKMSAKCMHDSCANKGWQQFKMVIGAPTTDHFDHLPTLCSRAEDPLTQGRLANSPPSAESYSVTTARDEQVHAKSLLQTPGRSVQLISSSQLAESTDRPEYLVPGILVAGQPAIVGGWAKTLKTSILCDLALSLGTGTPFLGHFPAVLARTAMLSGESGKWTLRETALRIARAKGVHLRDAQVDWGFELPQLANPLDLAALSKLIIQRGIQVLIIDPAYLCLMAGDSRVRQASNLLDMGPLLYGLTRLGEQANATILLCHHCSKTSHTASGIATLNDLAMAGFAEWARQWFLLGRRKLYQVGSGHHELVINVGGSAGHSGAWDLEIDEGLQHEEREWSVSVRDRNASGTLKAPQRAASQPKIGKGAETLREILRQYPDGETARVLGQKAKLNNKNFKKAISSLLSAGEAESLEIKKCGHRRTGYRTA